MEDSGLPDTQFHLLLQRHEDPRAPCPQPLGTTSSEPEKSALPRAKERLTLGGGGRDGAYTWVKILPGKSRRVHVTIQRTNLGILSLQSGAGGGTGGGRGAVGGGGCGRDCGPGKPPTRPLGGAQTLHSATRERLSFFNAFNVFQMVRCWLRWSSEAVLVAEGTPVPAPVSNPFLQETLDRDFAPPPFRRPISSRTVVLSRLVLPPPAPGPPESQGARVPPAAPRS